MKRRGASADRGDDRWELRTISTSSITPSHSIERSRRRPSTWYMRQPIRVIPTGSGYKIHDGNYRLNDAQRTGKDTMQAYVKMKEKFR